MASQEGDESERIDEGFDEMTKGYWDDGASKKFIDMDKPIPCYRQKTNSLGIHLEKIDLTKANSHGINLQPTEPGHQEDFESSRDAGDSCKIPKGELRGITVKQLRAIWANIKRRCKDEGWTSTKDDVTSLEPEDVTQYDIEKYIIKPFTKETKRSLVETLPSTAGAQPPVFSVSCSWGTSFYEILQCLEQLVLDFARNHDEEHEKKGGGMTEDTPIWLFAFAVSIDEREHEDTFNKDPCESVFVKAIRVAEFRVISILDKDGVTIKRIWCLLEMYVTLMRSHNAGVWAVYTAHPQNYHDGAPRAVGLCVGGTTSDTEANDTLNREKHFPTELIVEFIKFKAQNGEATNAKDRVRVLNVIAGITDSDNINVAPPKEDKKYEDFNDTFRAHFTTPGTLQKALIQKVSNEAEHWAPMLQVLSKGKMKYGMKFDFREGKGWDSLTSAQASELISNLPRTIRSLEITGSDYGPQFIEELATWIGKTVNLETLVLKNALVDAACTGRQGRKALKNLVDELKLVKRGTLKKLMVWGTDMTHMRTLLREECIARPAFAVLEEGGLYNCDIPDYDKITFLLAAFVNTEQSFNILPPGTDSRTIEWAYSLDDDRITTLFASKAGTFVKTILNEKFTTTKNLFITLLDLYIQITIVIAISFFLDSSSNALRVILLGCLTWISFREFLQMMTSSMENYILDVSNMVDLIQTFLVIWTVRSMPSSEPNDEKIFIATIFFVWVALIFQLSDVFFQLSTFVTALKEITRSLGPFLFTAILVNLMFAHMFRVEYSGEQCTRDDIVDMNITGLNIWKCGTIWQTYMKSFSMFLTDSDWKFDDNEGLPLTFIFSLVVGLVLLNVVIAVVSETFTDVQNDAEKAFWKHRLSLVQEVDSLWSLFSRIESLFRRGSKSGYDSIQKNGDEEVGNQSKMGGENDNGRNHRDEEIERFSFSISPSQREKERFSKDQALQTFTDWWFSPARREAPGLRKRLYIFYNQSLWRDIIFPGEVFERIILGLKYDADFCREAESMQGLELVKFGTRIFLVKIFRLIALALHVIGVVCVFTSGLFFGLSWPKPMRKFLFHEDPTPKSDVNATDGVTIDKLSEQVERLQEQNRRLIKYIEDNAQVIETLRGLRRETH